MQTPTITDTGYVEIVLTPWWQLIVVGVVAFLMGVYFGRRDRGSGPR